MSANELSAGERREATQPWGEWRRSSWGRYVPRYVEQTPRQRVAEAGVLLVPPSSVTGWGALAWQGARWFAGLEGDGSTPRPVDVAQPRRLIRPQPLLSLCEERFDYREVVVVDGLRVAAPARAACFAMRYAGNLREAVIAASMATYDDLASLDEIADWAVRHPSYTGIEQCRQAVVLAGENFWSPQEVGMLLDWTELTGSRPLTNRPVFDLGGSHIGTPDLIDPRTGVCGEYDGLLHMAGTRRAKDLKREAAFRRVGLYPVTMVAADRRAQAAWQQRLRDAYAEARRTPSTERRWTLELPQWWIPTWTVEQRRALSDQDRDRWLRRRLA
ncbi:MAG TPA: hypothetical protein PLZ93_10055 [Nocardioides sp.]|uniref:hypothetical protein n=1 Tax=uncultured Nocardioides sp. TaxID=198441 RepID=UPI00262A66CC|nr:hypothetical protein [uncultured Nocardioides sp.]HRD62750.1 hypothetical protein [Nocardioides sp.]HRI95946.1 hypothetical protein [Nocardioides sp.]HRK45748.1 hypothetical protein [Nocardioides sp.]